MKSFLILLKLSEYYLDIIRSSSENISKIRKLFTSQDFFHKFVAAAPIPCVNAVISYAMFALVILKLTMSLVIGSRCCRKNEIAFSGLRYSLLTGKVHVIFIAQITKQSMKTCLVSIFIAFLYVALTSGTDVRKYACFYSIMTNRPLENTFLFMCI